MKDPPRKLNISEILKKGDKSAIPDLIEAFEDTSDEEDKFKYAAALVKLGYEDEYYWNYLVDDAKEAIESDMPSPISYDEHGKSVKGKYNPEFLKWCEENGVEPAVAAKEALYRSYLSVYYLKLTDDPRAFEVYIQGLKSKNLMVVLQSAIGLAELQAHGAIQPIIEICNKAPAEFAEVIARKALIYFDDPEAQNAAEKFIKDEKLLNYLRKIIKQGDTP